MKYLSLLIFVLFVQGCSSFNNAYPSDVISSGFNGKMDEQPYLLYCDYILSNSERDLCSDEFLKEYILKNLEYPKEAIEKEIECNVLSKFIIKSDGSVSDIEVLQTCGDEFTKAVITLIENMPEWKPGLYKKKPVDVKYLLPLVFKLPSS